MSDTVREETDPVLAAVWQALQRGHRGNVFVQGWGDDLAKRAVAAAATVKPTSLFTVEVEDRSDNFYLFADESDARAFAQAVRDDGGRCYVVEEPVIDAAGAAALIEQERES